MGKAEDQTSELLRQIVRAGNAIRLKEAKFAGRPSGVEITLGTKAGRFSLIVHDFELDGGPPPTLLEGLRQLWVSLPAECRQEPPEPTNGRK